MEGDGDTQTLLDGKKVGLYAFEGSRDTTNFQFSLAPKH